MEHVLLSTEHWGGFNYTNDSRWNTFYYPLNTGVVSTIQMTHTGTRSIVHWTLGWPQLYKWFTMEHVLLSTEHWGGFNYTNDSHWNTLYCPLNTGVASTIQVIHNGTRSIIHWTLGLFQLYIWLTLEHALLSTEHWGRLNYTNDSHWNTLYCPLNTGVASIIKMTHTGTRCIVHWTLGSPQL